MKIGLISSQFFGVPPPKYGGLERIVYDLWRGLLDRGHKVICFSPDPTTTPEGGFHINTGKALSTVGVNWLETEREMLEKCEPYLADFDVIHEHNWFGHAYACKSRNQNLKICHSHHGHIAYWLDNEKNNPWWAKPAPFKLNMIAISKHMKELYESGYNGAAPSIPSNYCYNGVDMDSYPFQREKSNRLMFLGRIDPIKAPHAAIEVAEKTETPIDIVGGTSFVANNQYVSQMETKCAQSEYATFIGEVDHQTKLKYLQNAKALLIPSQFNEPFGLIAVEAMACGTVPIALRDGALPEIIEHGESGFICNSLDAIVKAVGEVDTISPEACRHQAEKFSKEVMAKKMEVLYNHILAGDEW